MKRKRLLRVALSQVLICHLSRQFLRPMTNGLIERSPGLFEHLYYRFIRMQNVLPKQMLIHAAVQKCDPPLRAAAREVSSAFFSAKEAFCCSRAVFCCELSRPRWPTARGGTQLKNSHTE